MKLLTFNDILDRAIEKYKVIVPNHKDGRRKFREKSIKKLRKISHTYPSPGTGSYFARALTNGGDTSARYFTESAADQIILLADNYFRKQSSDPHIRDMNSIIKEVSAAKAAEIKSRPSQEDLEEQFEEGQRIIVQRMRAAYDESRGNKPYDEEDFIEFAGQNTSAFSDSYFRSDETPDLSDYDEPVPASSDDIEKFVTDRRYGAVRKRSPFDEHKPPVITEIFERQKIDPGPKAEEIKRELVLAALFNYFYTPLDLESLKEDLFVASDPEDVHWDETYYLCKERLENYDNYTARKRSPLVHVDERFDNISHRLTAIQNDLDKKINRLEDKVTSLSSTGHSSSSSTSSIYTDSNGDIDELIKSVDWLRSQISNMNTIIFDLKKSVEQLTSRNPNGGG